MNRAMQNDTRIETRGSTGGAVEAHVGCGCRATSQEGGWALLGLLLAMSIMMVVLVSTVVPNVQMQVRRDKEIELRYRGEQMAEGIARYYNRGRLAPLQLLIPPPYGFLTELKKLREGVTFGVKEIKFVRPSACIDPTSGIEWEPVRARDPRIMKFLQAYAAETQTVIPQSYLLIAGPPQKLHLAQKPTEPEPAQGGQPSGTASQPQQPAQGAVPAPGRVLTPQPRQAEDSDDDDDDDDDDEDEANVDPLAHLFSDIGAPGHSSVPIVGVAPHLKGKAARPLYGLDKYEDWIFIYLPTQFQMNQLPGGGNSIRRPSVTAPTPLQRRLN
jgi:type II secretory pathway pseudopilin PulG